MKNPLTKQEQEEIELMRAEEEQDLLEKIAEFEKGCLQRK